MSESKQQNLLTYIAYLCEPKQGQAIAIGDNKKVLDYILNDMANPSGFKNRLMNYL